MHTHAKPEGKHNRKNQEEDLADKNKTLGQLRYVRALCAGHKMKSRRWKLGLFVFMEPPSLLCSIDSWREGKKRKKEVVFPKSQKSVILSPFRITQIVLIKRQISLIDCLKEIATDFFD
jgi:hypothetical protein